MDTKPTDTHIRSFRMYDGNYNIISQFASIKSKETGNQETFIEARNNDGANKLNKATYSTDLILQLMNIYVKPDSLVYDPFSGTCTTQNACVIYGCDYIGSELSKAQVTEGEMRINKTRESLNGNRFKSWDEYINYINN